MPSRGWATGLPDARQAALGGDPAAAFDGPISLSVDEAGNNPANFLQVDEVTDVVRYLLHTGDNVKLGPQVLLRTMRNPMGT